jgi:hypothetical protein
MSAHGLTRRVPAPAQCAGRILVSDRAHLLFDLHKEVDGAREAELAVRCSAALLPRTRALGFWRTRTHALTAARAAPRRAT